MEILKSAPANGEPDSAESYAPTMVQWRKFSALCAFLACIAALHTQATTTDNAAQHQVGAAASAAQPDNRHLWSPARVAARTGLLTLRLRGGMGGKSEPRKDNHKHHKGSNHEDEPVLCRYKKAGSHFEIMCLPSFVELYREGKATRDEAAVGGEVFKDAKLGDRPSATELEEAFGTGDHLECIDIILQKGEYQLTVAERKRKTDEKTAQIVGYITSNYMDGKTKMPVPATRVEQGIASIKGLKIDPYKATWFQSQDIAKKLKESLSLVKNEVTATVTVGIAMAGQVSGSLHTTATVTNEDYVDSSAVFSISFMSGDYDRIVSELTKVTNGDYELVTERGAEGADATFQGAVEGGGGGGGKKKGKSGKGK